MAESTPIVKDAEQDKASSINGSATFEQLQALLKAKDDTSRFVGLALLKSILDNEELEHNPEQIGKYWRLIPVKFLDRLLRSHASAKVGKAESKDMMDLAVSILHTFTVLLPEDARRQEALLGRIKPITQTLVQR